MSGWDRHVGQELGDLIVAGCPQSAERLRAAELCDPGK
jgi:hypothetical protein